MNGETLATYNAAAPALAEYFAGIGARTNYVEEALWLADKLDGTADVLELGCGDGRDAAEIIPRASSYWGIDYSEGLLDIARQKLPDANFHEADMAAIDFPEEAFDVVFAFASLLHLDSADVALVLSRLHRAMRPGGILYISTKCPDASDYEEDWQHDQFGARLFYFYSPEKLAMLAGAGFEVVKSEVEIKHSKPWTEMALRKI